MFEVFLCLVTTNNLYRKCFALLGAKTKKPDGLGLAEAEPSLCLRKLLFVFLLYVPPGGAK